MGTIVVGAIDIGGTKIGVGLVDPAGRIIAESVTPTAPDLGYPQACKRIGDSLAELLIETEATIAGIGVGSAGPIDPQSGVYGEVGTLPGWRGAPLGSDLEKRFGVPVVVENDADAGALAEALWGAGTNSDSLIYVTVSTGIGVGFLPGDHIFRGVHGSHPEIGHQIVDAGNEATTPLCYCGVRGCWESLASGSALETYFKSVTGEACDAATICERARQGDKAACTAIEREVRYLAIGLANLVTMFCPQTIALGGGMMQSADLLLAPAVAGVRRMVTQVPVQNTSIVQSKLSTKTGLLGAAGAWFYRVPVGQYTGSKKSLEQ